MSSTPSFGRQGHPRKIPFSDFFLVSPMIDLELSGISLSATMGDEYREVLALFRDLGRRRAISIKRAKAVLPGFLADTGFPWATEFERALGGEETALSDVGHWQIYVYAQAQAKDGQWPPKLSVLGQHIIELEQALKVPTAAWAQGDVPRCVDLLEASPMLKNYLWPALIANLRRASTEGEVTTARGLVMCEIWLSFLACQDARIQGEGRAEASTFDDIFPNFAQEPVKSPNALFFEWLERYSNTQGKLSRKIPQLSKAANSKDVDLASLIRQLRRWKSGDGFPSYDMLDGLFRNLYGDKADKPNHPGHEKWQLSQMKAAATKRIAFLASILVRLNRLKEPVAPFGYPSIQDWRESRYWYWYRHWLPIQAEQLKVA